MLKTETKRNTVRMNKPLHGEEIGLMKSKTSLQNSCHIKKMVFEIEYTLN